MGLAAFLYMGLVLLLGSLITGITSFGGNLFIIPLLTIVMDVKLAIAYGAYGGLVVLFALLFLYRKHLLWKEGVILGISGLLGVPLGLWIFTTAGAKALLLTCGFCIVFFLVWQAIAGKFHFGEQKVKIFWAVPAGFFSGIMMGAAAMGGPPIVLYAYARKWSKENTIGSVNVAAIIMLAYVLPGMWANLRITPDQAKEIAVGAIFALAGLLCSLPIVHRINTRIFRIGLLLMLGFSAFMLLARGFAQ